MRIVHFKDFLGLGIVFWVCGLLALSSTHLSSIFNTFKENKLILVLL